MGQQMAKAVLRIACHLVWFLGESAGFIAMNESVNLDFAA